MSKVEFTYAHNTSPYQDYYQLMFEGADYVSAFWQPVFKGYGRGQLELAHLGAKQGQAVMQWGRTIAMAPSPAGIAAAYVQLWQAIADQYTESSCKLATAVTQAAQQTAAFEVLTLPVNRSRDTLVIQPLDAAHDAHRKVA